MRAADPTYPLYPIASALASAMLLVVLVNSFIRQSWNLGVAFLCFWLFVELLTATINHVVWSDNADVKLYIYCDIVTHTQMITYIVKPMATLIITRRLYLIASLQTVELPSKRRWDLAVEWTLGLVIPLLVAGPIYYVNQGTRFAIDESFGCAITFELSVLEILVLDSWTIVPPLVSIAIYYPEVAKLYYRQRKDINSFLRSNSSVSRTNYLRILILASIDILLTLPLAIVDITLKIVQGLDNPSSFPFYPGWTLLHTAWEPESFSYAEQQSFGTAYVAGSYFSNWSSPVLAFAIFGLFGLTSEARTSYWRIICTIGRWFGWKPTPRARNGQASVGEIEFGARPQATTGTSGFDLEMGSRPPSFVNTEAVAARQNIEDGLGGGSATDLKSVEEARPGERSDGKDVQSNDCRITGGDEPYKNVKRASVASNRSLEDAQASSNDDYVVADTHGKGEDACVV
ncbi:unnamed protein product [Peniophora sp. CBMAI 1063]|nr:unnamed protein product [Peniophora sp. CBMAI 1063]